MMSAGEELEPLEEVVVTPTLLKQCIGFMIGSALFAVGSAPGFADWAGVQTANICFFVGSWFFTAAGLVQLVLSEPARTAARAFRVQWLAAATQSAGTVLFNISTGAVFIAHSVLGQKALVWRPDAVGSVAFLISGAFGILALRRGGFSGSRLADIDWWSTLINFLGCVAFGVSAVGAYIVIDGETLSAELAQGGTFVGAICFFIASGVLLPKALRAD